LDEFDVAECVGREFNGLIEPVLSTIANINNFDDFSAQARVKKVTSAQFRLEISAPSEHKASDIYFVVGDKMLDRQFRDLSHIVVSLLITETRETQSRLSSAAVLLGKVHSELVHDLTSVARKGAKQGTVSIHHNKSEALV